VPSGQADAFIGLAALGTIADMMPLRGENRTIVRRGWGESWSCRGYAPGSGRGCLRPLVASDIAFGLAPRINAAGRMEDARVALDLCLSDDPEECSGLARHLDQQNRSRQEAVAAALAEAEVRVAELPDEAPAIVIGDPGWPMGSWTGGRTPDGAVLAPHLRGLPRPRRGQGIGSLGCGVHIVRALDHAASTLLRYGGHAAAAGFSLRAEDFGRFRDLISEACAEQAAAGRASASSTSTARSGARTRPSTSAPRLRGWSPAGSATPPRCSPSVAARWSARGPSAERAAREGGAPG